MVEEARRESEFAIALRLDLAAKYGEVAILGRKEDSLYVLIQGEGRKI